MEDYFNRSRPLHNLKKDQRLVQGLQATGSKSPTSATNEPCRLPKYPTSDTHLHSHQKVHVFNSAKNNKNTWTFRCDYKFFWHLNEKASYGTEFSALNVVPSPDFLRERWAGTMDQWEQSMENAYVLNSKSYISNFRFNFLVLRTSPI